MGLVNTTEGVQSVCLFPTGLAKTLGGAGGTHPQDSGNSDVKQKCFSRLSRFAELQHDLIHRPAQGVWTSPCSGVRALVPVLPCARQGLAKPMYAVLLNCTYANQGDSEA